MFLLFPDLLNGLDLRARELIYGSKAPSTWSKYDAAFRRFEIWAKKLGLVPFPASASTVIRFFAFLADETKSVNSVSTALCAITAKHNLEGFPNPCKDPRVSAICEGIKRRFFKPHKQCKPLTQEIIEAIARKKLGKKSDRGSVKDWRTVWLALMTFRCCARYDDIARLRLPDLVFGERDLTICFRFRKNDQIGRGHKVEIKESPSRMCLVKKSREYLSTIRRLGAPRDGFALPRMDRLSNGQFKCYWDQKASYNSCRLSFLNALCAAGYDSEGYGLHSGKVGGVVALREGGLSWRSLCDFVGWAPKSAMPERYAKESRRSKTKASSLLEI